MSDHQCSVTQIYKDGDSYFDSLVESIESSTESIYIETYIFELPEPGLRILNLLERKFKTGVDVKILVDGFGSYSSLDDLLHWSENSWVPVQVYHPLPNFFKWTHFLTNLKSINRRNHRKVTIIDRKIAFIGSINFSKVHFKAFSQKPWFDLSVKIEGPSVRILETAFNHLFLKKKNLSTELIAEIKSLIPKRSPLFPLKQKFRLNSNFFLRFLYWRDLLKRIRMAEKHVYIMNAYFVPHRTLIRSLSVAARKGVKVELLLPSDSDVPFVKWMAPMFYPKLIQMGIGISELTTEMIHTKSIIIDEWALIGSNNLNYRSLIHDLEVDVVIDEPQLISELKEIWSLKSKSAQKLTLADVSQLSLFKLIKYRLVLFFRYFI